jgi:hypothetical protein
MNDEEIHRARQMFRARIDSLRNDVLRAFWPLAAPAAPSGSRPSALVYNQPQFAPFPAVMYCFATVDYFSSFWEGWNDRNSPHYPGHNRSQTDRMLDYLCLFFRYPRREAFIAINIWRHKLMHTAQPRIVTTGEATPRTFWWLCGPDLEGHMRLRQDDPAKYEFILPFACNEFVRDLEEAVFGPIGYFHALVRNETYPGAHAASPVAPMPPPPAPAIAGPGAPAAVAAGALAAAPPATPLQDNSTHCWTELETCSIRLAERGL